MIRLMHLDELIVASKSTLIKEQVIVEMGALIEELEKLKGSNDTMESATFLCKSTSNFTTGLHRNAEESHRCTLNRTRKRE
ncbi:hypothetical protein Tco_0978233 [Tanacetum coccineum]|uniref:Uncharacterized protein n=1 Tax=Tanacetum coccineum TaxID=301880 RepID=A0ABQ5EMD5_9ASTR